VLRHHVVCEKDQAVADDLRRNVPWRDYQRIELDAPDTRFDNREAMPDGHPFRTVDGAPRLVVFRRRPGGRASAP
jgi:hypothetical protein